MSRVIVFGGRDFTDFDLLTATLDRLAEKLGELVVVSGCAAGADTLGEKWAELRGYKIVRFPADWQKHGKIAGPVRNREMAVYAREGIPHAVGFWDGKSRGTADMIGVCNNRGIPLKVVMYSKNPSKEE